jgi:hypothetical protein
LQQIQKISRIDSENYTPEIIWIQAAAVDILHICFWLG